MGPRQPKVSVNDEIAAGNRFSFGGNWKRFLAVLDERRVIEATESLTAMTGRPRLTDLTFLDIGSGSGLFSLAATRLGARVRSFDYDLESVECTTALRNRFGIDPSRWAIEQGSILDPAYVARLGTFDIVYSWGVLHHTGDMWTALANTASLVNPHGQLLVAIYNDQGRASRCWSQVKRLYCALPSALKPLVLYPSAVWLLGPRTVLDILRLKPFHTWREYYRSRGMSVWHDVVDWVGGYPFEVAKPEAVFDFYRRRGFVLSRLQTVGGSMGCNEFSFDRLPASVGASGAAHG
jgi:2-polyprenyl-6-hydroxyphenyl methylase/3-demethylubiquinone-9 3-methyltransferase